MHYRKGAETQRRAKKMEKGRYNELSAIILDSAIAVHREMGPGLLESVYQFCMAYELRSRGIDVKEYCTVPLIYKGVSLSKEYEMDLLIENEIIAELKAVELVLQIHEAQLISHLKLANKKLGFLINFNVPLLKHGFKRFVNGF